jgi:hypothetical protein
VSLRAIIVTLIVLATAGFVVGVTIERNTSEPHAERHVESGEQGEAGHVDAQAGSETHAEFQPFGVDIEAVPFIVLAALASLGMAAAVWTWPTSVPVLVIVAAAMLLFALLDVREVFHQADENRTGLAILAGAVAGLHLAASAATALLAATGERTVPGRSAAPGSRPAT